MAAPAYYYSSTAGSYTLTSSVTSTSGSLIVNSVTGLPGNVPFKVVVDPGGTSEEICKVTGVIGTTLTVTRGWDGTTGYDHAAGAVVRHMLTAEDMTLSRTHEAATAAHGVTGDVVGTTDTQIVSHKDFTDATNLFPASLATDAELANHTTATAAHGATGAVVGTTNTQALTNKDLTSGTNTFPTSLATLTGTQALTNKDLTGAGNVFPARMNDYGLETTGILTPASGWTIVDTQGVRRNGHASLYIQATPSATITSSGGDVTNTVIGTIAVAWTPLVPASGSTAASGPVADYTVWTDRSVSITAAAASITGGTTLSFYVHYPLANL